MAFQLKAVAVYGFDPASVAFHALVTDAFASCHDTDQLFTVDAVSLVTLISPVNPPPQLLVTVYVHAAQVCWLVTNRILAVNAETFNKLKTCFCFVDEFI